MRINSGPRQGDEDLVGRLKVLLDPKASVDRVVFIVAEDGCNYSGRFVHVLDGAREAGAEVLGFATDRPDPAMFL